MDVKSRWMWLLGVTSAIVVGSSLMIPAAVGAAPQTKTAAGTAERAVGTPAVGPFPYAKATPSPAICTATRARFIGNTGIIALAARGRGASGTGTATSCTA